MGQDPHWTLPGNSLNMELYYKDHLHLIENGNMKTITIDHSNSTSIYCNISMYFYFSILSYAHNSLLIFCSSIYDLPSSRTSSSIKKTTCNFRFFFTQHVTKDVQISPAVPYVACGFMHASGFTGKDNNEIASCLYSFFTLFIQL